MRYKRLEIYVWWTCNQRCTYCMEYSNMEEAWNKKVTKYDILRKLLKYKRLGYNHVTFLWGEPFIQKVFIYALKIAKKLWYTILVTTNCSTLHIPSQAQKFLPFIDELILSIQAIDPLLQKRISQTNVSVKWEEVFNNIKRYWRWSMIKGNIVITQDNLEELYNIVKFIICKWIKNIAITYPDIDISYYGREHIKKRVAPKYSKCIDKIQPIVNFCKENNIIIKLADFPYCLFPQEEKELYIPLTDDYDYETRVKIKHTEEEVNRWKLDNNDTIPRNRFWSWECEKCIYKWKCWGPSIPYKEIYWYKEIIAIKK